MLDHLHILITNIIHLKTIKNKFDKFENFPKDKD